MNGLHPVSYARHANLRWRRFDDYRFAATTVIGPLAAAELPKAALAMPLAFIQPEGKWTLAAVLGLLPGQNLYIGPGGRWLTGYVPAFFRSYPFRLSKNDAGQLQMLVDEGSGLVVKGSEGELFFDETGEAAAALKQAWSFLQDTAQSETVLAQACDTLHSAGVIEPWPIAVQGEHGTQQVAGLHRINEVALNGLDDATFSQLRRGGIVGIAYAQLLSMGNLPHLGQLAQARAQAEAAERAKAEVKPMIALPNDSTIDWDWSKIGR